MAANISCPEKPWQNSLVGSGDKLNALFNNGSFSDLTITFPGQGIAYKAHRLIMAVSSSIFEEMLFGPMAVKSSELELPDDNPKAFKIVLGSCYGLAIEISDIDMAIEVYILADKYFMEQLGKECAQHIGKLLNSKNINKVLQFATRYNIDSYFMEHLVKECAHNIGKWLNRGNVNKVLEFANHCNIDSLKTTCFKQLESRNDDDVFDSTKTLLALQPDRLQEVLNSNIVISNLLFLNSWRYPGKILNEDIIMKLIESDCCSYRGISRFYGCVSAKVVSNICWSVEGEWANDLCLSFSNLQQANEVISVLYDGNFNEFLYIHLQCNTIPANQLMRLPSFSDYQLPTLFISNVNDTGIEWVVSAACSLIPEDGMFDRISFPESELTLSGLKELITRLASVCVEYWAIEVCSSDLSLENINNQEIMEWVKLNVPQLLDTYQPSYVFNEGINKIEKW